MNFLDLIANAGALVVNCAGNEGKKLMRNPLCTKILRVGALDKSNDVPQFSNGVDVLIYIHRVQK